MKRQQRKSQKMLHARPPSIRPLLLEGVDQTGGDQRPVLFGDIGERVVAIGAIGIGGIPIERSVACGLGDGSREIAMRINQIKPWFWTIYCLAICAMRVDFPVPV